jgi:hypothetical protein
MTNLSGNDHARHRRTALSFAVADARVIVHYGPSKAETGGGVSTIRITGGHAEITPANPNGSA